MLGWSITPLREEDHGISNQRGYAGKIDVKEGSRSATSLKGCRFWRSDADRFEPSFLRAKLKILRNGMGG
jgi:hypothetical protein